MLKGRERAGSSGNSLPALEEREGGSRRERARARASAARKETDTRTPHFSCTLLAIRSRLSNFLSPRIAMSRETFAG
jgi:hypothetical protein